MPTFVPSDKYFHDFQQWRKNCGAANFLFVTVNDLVLTEFGTIKPSLDPIEVSDL